MLTYADNTGVLETYADNTGVVEIDALHVCVESMLPVAALIFGADRCLKAS